MFPALLLFIVHSSTEPAPPPRLVGELVELQTKTGTLHGTIDLPPTPGPWPIIILHAGSGPTDRDGNGPLVATNCLKQVGRALAAEGYAVLRFDKRGIAASARAMKKQEELTIDGYAADVLAWAALLRKDSRFTSLGYIGHSEGALIGLIAAKETQFDAFVSLCGPGRPLQTVLREQLKKNLSEELFKQSNEIITELEEGRTVKDVPKELASLFHPSVQPFLISLFHHDPAKLIAKVKAPLLIISGSTDIQVTQEDAKHLSEANAKASTVTIGEMNHVLKQLKQTTRESQLPSYRDATLPLHPKLLPELTRFFKQTLGGSQHPPL